MKQILLKPSETCDAHASAFQQAGCLLAAVIILVLMVSGCQTTRAKGTIGRLRNQKIDIENVEIEGGLDKAMASYQRFLEETPDSELSPSAIKAAIFSSIISISSVLDCTLWIVRSRL